MDHTFLLVLLLVIVGLLLPVLVLSMPTVRRILPYLYVIARIRAKEARLLKPETLEQMVNTSSVAEIASILENSEYALAMQGLVMESAESIEELLIRQIADIYSEIVSMLPRKMQQVFSYLKQQWDVHNLKSILRSLRSGEPPEYAISRLVPFGELDTILLRKMVEAGDIDDALPLLEATPYGQLIALLPVYHQEKSLLPLESMLDKIMLESMWDRISADRELLNLRPSFAIRIDALNYKILLRAKRDQLLLVDVQKYLVQGGDLLPALLRIFDEVDDLHALIAEIASGPFYPALMEVLPESERTGSLFPLEKRLDEVVLALGKQIAIKQPYGIAPILGYLSKKDTEIRNIRTITRAKEAGLSIELIRNLVLKPA